MATWDTTDQGSLSNDYFISNVKSYTLKALAMKHFVKFYKSYMLTLSINPMWYLVRQTKLIPRVGHYCWRVSS